MLNLSSLKESTWRGHVFAWLGGVLFALMPHVLDWKFGTAEVPMRLGGGYLGYDLVIASLLVFTGGLLAGTWWRLCCWMKGGSDVALEGIAAALFGFSLLGIMEITDQFYFYYVIIALMFSGLVYAFVNKKGDSLPERGSFRDWSKQKHRANILFFLFFFLILTMNNAMSVIMLEIGTGEKVSVLFGRTCFALFVTGIGYFLSEASMRTAPKCFRWVPWVILSTTALLVFVDMGMRIRFSRGVLEMVNSLTQNNELNIEKELAGGGVTWGDKSQVLEWQARLGVVLAIIAVSFLTYLLWRASRNIKFRVNMKIVFLMVCGAFLVGAAEKGIGATWKGLSSRQVVNKHFLLDFGVFTPRLGVGTFEVEFYEDEATVYDVPRMEKRPDIFVIMVESWRADSINEVNTPFMMEFQKECQPIETTWSGSNATHLSWYSFFYSKPSFFWRSELESIDDKEEYRGSPVLETFNNLGYDIEIRAVCDLEYKSFGLLNFGLDDQLATVMEQANDGSPLREYGIPKREVIIFDNMKKAVLSRPAGDGAFYYTALDSPHYNYYWHEDFEPPHSDYQEDTTFPLFPTDDELQLYKNKYANAVAWVDHQVEDFVNFLKKEGRYDNSIIIVTGDHGEEFQEQGGWYHCTALIPEQIQVPILIKWPKSYGKGEPQKLASHMDVMPSVLSYLGAPEKCFETMSGKNLLEKQDEHTVIVTTAFAVKNGEAMVLKRNGYSAFFSWKNPWTAEVPDKIVLERIEGPDGKLDLKTPAEYEKKLRELYPDAFERYFKKLTLVE